MRKYLLTLRAARTNMGFTLCEAATILGIHKDTLSKYERNSTNVPRGFLIKIPTIYKVPLDDIFFGKESDFFRNMRQVDFEREVS